MNRLPTKAAAAVVVFFLAASVTFAGGSAEQAASASTRPSAGAAPVELSVGYMPILPDAQLFIIMGNGWAKDAGIDLKLTRFSDGPAIVQAVGSGKLDVMYFGIGPAMVARSKGQDIKVVASNIVEQIGFIARPDLVKYFDSSDPGAMFGKFQNAEGRKVKIATFPSGSVPDTVLRYWLDKQLGIGTEGVSILSMGADQVQQALLSGSVDAASILEPTLTIVEEKVPGAKVLARSAKMFPHQPGAVVAVRQSVISAHPDAIEKLIALHVRATNFLKSNPDKSAEIISHFIGAGLVSAATLKKALESPSTNFVADPRKIVASTQTMQDFQQKMGTLAHPVDLSSLFDTSLYEKAVGAGSAVSNR